MLFNKDGILMLDEAMIKNPSFMRIMEDGVVTCEELEAQVQKVSNMLHETETRFSSEDLEWIEQLLVESNVLFAVYKQYEIQNI